MSDVGWFSELPDEVALKVPVGGDEVEVLAAHLARLAGNAELRARMSAAARALAEREHDVGRVADAYAETLEQAAGGQAVDEQSPRRFASAAAEVGLEPSGDAVGEIAERLREVGHGR